MSCFNNIFAYKPSSSDGRCNNFSTYGERLERFFKQIDIWCSQAGRNLICDILYYKPVKSVCGYQPFGAT